MAMTLRRVGLLMLVAVVVASASADDNTDAPEVTLAGGKIRGYWRKSRGGQQFAAFEGVPYARPPVKELRFQPPKPVENWTDVKVATKVASFCPQRNLVLRKKDIEGQEDCLYANIYSSDIKSTEPLDVMIYVHGGAWMCGSGDVYQPDYLLDKKIVFVNFNYRLGPLGFLSTSDDVISGNNGFKDMVMLLKWVKENIAKFGGNPNSVTVFGESAGGASVHLLTLSPLAKGLFHRAITQSGSALAPWAFSPPVEAKKNAATLAKALGCAPTPSKDFLTCMQTKTANDIIATDAALVEWRHNIPVTFKPVLEKGEGAFLTQQPRSIYTTTGPITDVPLIVGITAQDGAIAAINIFKNSTALKELDQNFKQLGATSLFMTHYPKAQVEEALTKARKFYFGNDTLKPEQFTNGTNFYSDGLFIWPALETVLLQQKHAKSKTWLYEYSHVNSRSFSLLFGADVSEIKKYGAHHGDDLISIFPMKEVFPDLKPTEADNATSKTVVEYFTTFAKTGRPTADDKWKNVAEGVDDYMHIGSPGDVAVRSNFKSCQRFKFWNDLPLKLGEVPILSS